MSGTNLKNSNNLTNRRWMGYQVTIWLIFAIVVLLFIFENYPYPRPYYTFAGIGLCFTLMTLQIYQDDQLNKISVSFLLFSMIVVSFFLRWSMWVRVVAASGDHISHFSFRAGHIITEGHIISKGMYARNPLTHILLSINGLILNLWIFDVRFISVIVSSLLPLLAILSFKEILGLRNSLFVGILFGVFPLALRSGSMFETESLVLPFFLIELSLLTFIYYKRSKFRSKLLFTFVLIALVFVHSLYPLIIIGIFISLFFVMKFISSIPEMDLKNNYTLAQPSIGTISILILAFYRVFSSELGTIRIIRFLSGPSTTIPSNPLFLFLPSSGAVGKSTQVGASSSLIDVILNYTPVLILALLTLVGGVYVLCNIRGNDRYTFLIGLSATTLLATLVGLILFRSAETMRVGFRLYYLLGVIGLAFAAITIKNVQDTKLLLSIVILMILLYSALAPMSTLGNNVDPQFGGLNKGLTIAESDQLNTINSYTKGDEMLYPQQDGIILVKNGPFVPRAHNKYSLRASSKRCLHKNRVWSSNSFSLCV